MNLYAVAAIIAVVLLAGLLLVLGVYWRLSQSVADAIASAEDEFQFLDGAGHRWRRYRVEYDSPDGTYETEIWAISFEHAELQLASLKETARIAGEIAMEIPA